MSPAAPATALQADTPETEARAYRRELRQGKPPIYRIDLFLNELRGAQLHIGAREQIRVRRLLLRLAASGESPRNFRELGGWVAPLLATSPEQQARIHAHCGEMDRELLRPADDKARKERAKRFRVLVILGAVALAIALASGAYFWLWADWTPTPLPQRQPEKDPTPPGSGTSPDFWWPELSFSGIARFVAALLPLAFAVYAMLRKAPAQAVLRREEAQTGKTAADAGRERRIRFYRGARAAFARRTQPSGLGRLKIRRETASLRLDEPRTVELAARSHGLLTRLIYGRQSITVSHVVLIDRALPGDHLGALGDILVERLRQAEVPVEAWDFHSDPTRLTPVGALLAASLRMTGLQELAARHEGDLMVIVSDGARFLHPVTREPAPWIGELSGFAQLALFTPVPPRDWGAREQALAAAGFRLFPASADGAAEYASEIALWAEDPDPEVEPRAVEVRTRRRTVAIPERFVYGPEPSREEVERLMFELQSLLEPEAFELLCALGCAPVTDPELTLFLGNALLDGAGRPILNEARLTELTRLAWLREGYMPLWFCRELMCRLPPQRFDQVKRAIVEFIARPVSGVPSGPELALEYDAEFAGRAEEGLKRLPTKDPRRDRLYMTFVRAKDKEALDIEIRPPDPEEERRRQWLGQRRRLIRAAVAGLVLYALWPAFVEFGRSIPLFEQLRTYLEDLWLSGAWERMHPWLLVTALVAWVLSIWLQKAFNQAQSLASVVVLVVRVLGIAFHARLDMGHVAGRLATSFQKSLQAGHISSLAAAAQLAITRLGWVASTLAGFVFLADVGVLAMVLAVPEIALLAQRANPTEGLALTPLRMALAALAVGIATMHHRVPEVPVELKDLFIAPAPGRRILGFFAAAMAVALAVWLQIVHRDLSEAAAAPAVFMAVAVMVAGWAFSPGSTDNGNAFGTSPWRSALKGPALAFLVVVGAVFIDEGLLQPLLDGFVFRSGPPRHLMFAAALGLIGGWMWRSASAGYALAFAPMLIAALGAFAGWSEESHSRDFVLMQMLLLLPLAIAGAAGTISVALWREHAIGAGRMLASIVVVFVAWVAGLMVSAFVLSAIRDSFSFGRSGEDALGALMPSVAVATGVSGYFLFIRRGLKAKLAEQSTSLQPRRGPAGLLFIPLFWLISFSIHATPVVRLDVTSLGVPLAAYVGWRFGAWGFYAVLIGGLTHLFGFSAGPISTSGSLGTYLLIVAVARLFSTGDPSARVLQPRPVTPALLFLLAVMFGLALYLDFGFSRISITAEPYSYYLLFMLGLSGTPGRWLLAVALAIGAVGLGMNVFRAGFWDTGQVAYFLPVNSPAELLAIPFCYWMGRGVRDGLLTTTLIDSAWRFWISLPGILLLLTFGIVQLTMINAMIALANAGFVLRLFNYASVAVLAFAAGALHGWRGFAWVLGIGVVTGILAPVAAAALQYAGVLEHIDFRSSWFRLSLGDRVNLSFALGAIGLAWFGATVRPSLVGSAVR